MYVDDLLLGAYTVDEALKYSKEPLDSFQNLDSFGNMSSQKLQINSSILKERLLDTSTDTNLFKI